MGGFFIYRNLYVNWNKSSPRYSPYGAIIPDIVKVQLLVSHQLNLPWMGGFVFFEIYLLIWISPRQDTPPTGYYP